MDIKNVIKNTLNDINKDNAGGSQGRNISELLELEILTENDCIEIFNAWKNDLEIYIEEYARKSGDPNGDKGMYKCSLETWEACVSDIGRDYYIKNKYLYDVKKNRAAGGVAYRDDLLMIGMEVYEYFCTKYRKQFFIYDCTRFLGLSKEVLYRLNNIHSDMLKRAHTCQEASMRAALASGRSNVTAMAILLNHDYNYTKTTEIIHSSDRIKSADTLPVLNAHEKTILIEEKNHDLTL